MTNKKLTPKRISAGICTTGDARCSGFMTEFSEEYPISGTNQDKGVTMNHEGSNDRLIYSGILAKSGASHIYAAVSHGENANWTDTTYYQMNRTGNNTFEVLVPHSRNMNVNVAFKDCANNWDNNSGHNYSFNAH